jgi:hypothetical protein|tara:strand:+ start:952 stop:1197 length:246 start_codon:yes stop_codon:yes gene_type:complete
MKLILITKGVNEVSNYKVSFGKARCWNEKSTKENTRYRFFDSEKKAWAFIERLNKFSFMDSTLKDMPLIAWNDLEKLPNER